MKCYTDGLAVGVTNQLRKDGDAVRARDRYRKWWILKNVMFAVDTDPPSPAPPQRKLWKRSEPAENDCGGPAGTAHELPPGLGSIEEFFSQPCLSTCRNPCTSIACIRMIRTARSAEALRAPRSSSGHGSPPEGVRRHITHPVMY